MRVICISGKAGSGKDTAASDLYDFLGRGGDVKVLVTHFADLTKYIAKNYFGWSGEKDQSGRDVLQRVGTDLFRTYNENFWVDFIADILTVSDERWDYVIIPDTRFPNEIERLEGRGFQVTTIRVCRDKKYSALSEMQKQHESETSLDHYKMDFEVNNNGTRMELACKMAEIANKIYNSDNYYQITFDDII